MGSAPNIGADPYSWLALFQALRWLLWSLWTSGAIPVLVLLVLLVLVPLYLRRR